VPSISSADELQAETPAEELDALSFSLDARRMDGYSQCVHGIAED
jgi:hypothetical protein